MRLTKRHGTGRGRAGRGQTSIEFIVLLGFLLIVFLAFSVVIQGKIREQQRLNRYDLYVQVADLVEKELLLAQRVHHGYIRSFDLPYQLDKQPYTVSLESGDSGSTYDSLVVRSGDEEYLRFMAVAVKLEGPVICDSDSGGCLLFPPDTPRVMVQKVRAVTDTIYLRYDCVEDGTAPDDCAPP